MLGVERTEGRIYHEPETSGLMNAAPESLQRVLDRTFAEISHAREVFTPQLTPREVGTVISVATGIAKVSGLPGVGFEELVMFPGDVPGIAFNGRG